MKIQTITFGPYTEGVEPALLLDLQYTFPRGERLPLDLTVTVRGEDRRVLGAARPISREPAVLPLDTVEQGQGLPDAVERVSVLLPLTPRVLDHMERLRTAHRKGDVILHCDIQVHFLVSVAKNAHFVLAQRDRDSFDVTYRYQTDFKPNIGHGNMWVLSGNGSRTFAHRDVWRESVTATINSSDWVHDYSGPWRTTEHLILEVPRQQVVAGATGLQTWINPAIDAIEAATENLRVGDWNDVVEDLRPVWELFRSHPDIKALLEADGFSADAASALNDSVRSQFDLASKFVHRTDKSGKKVAPEIRASKEDAYLVYTLAAAVVNLIAKKLERTTRK